MTIRLYVTSMLKHCKKRPFSPRSNALRIMPRHVEGTADFWKKNAAIDKEVFKLVDSLFLVSPVASYTSRFSSTDIPITNLYLLYFSSQEDFTFTYIFIHNGSFSS